MEDSKIQLYVSQLRHANSLLQGKLRAIEAQVMHNQAVHEQRIRSLEAQVKDHEERLRTVTEGVTQFKIFSGLASGGSGIMSLVAVIRTFLGG